MNVHEPGFSLGFRFKRLFGTFGWGFQWRGVGKRLERAFDAVIFGFIGLFSFRRHEYGPGEKWMAYATALGIFFLAFLIAFFFHWFIWGHGSR